MSTAMHDVVILGAGYTGSLAGLILARKGYSVCIVDREPMPRFVIGESTRNEQNRIHSDLARRYDLPELAALSSFGRLKSSGAAIDAWPKEAFYFLTNPAAGDGPSGAPGELLHQTAPWPIGPDYHCRRDGFDLHLFNLAVKRGVTGLIGAEITELEFGDSVRGTYRHEGQEHELTSRFFVDASGGGAFLSRQLDLRDENPSILSLRSRTVFSHFIGVRPLEEVMREEPWGRSAPHLPIQRDHATVHHLAHEGWTWVIPFESGVTSVGLVFNMDREEPGFDALLAREQFEKGVAANPALAATMASADPVRPFIASGRMQWLSKQVVGDRWVILPTACGFADPLLSPGMTLCAAGVARLVASIDPVLREGRPAREALRPVEERFYQEAEHFCRLQHCLFMAMGDAELFSAVQTIDRLATQVGALTLAGDSGDSGPPVLWGMDQEPVRKLVDDVHGMLIEAGGRDMAPPGLAGEVRAHVERGDVYGFLRSEFSHPHRKDIYLHPLVPLLRWANSVSRSTDPSVTEAVRSSSGSWLGTLPRLAVRTLVLLVSGLRRRRTNWGGVSSAGRHLLILLGLRR